ncbi:glycogen debranching protein [Candidatus Bathyarchaeota archaeon]|nr:MAG: glycogen debranching protein [Candidatus Bathyarchaeota archaeon]
MKSPSITLSKETLANFEEAIRKEWIITNGLGGYASSTVLGLNTRKYHGLLIAAFHPPGDRRVCLVKLDEEIKIGNNIYPLGANEFQNGIFPQGHMFLKEFSISPFPRYTYQVEDVEVQKTIFMPHEKNAVTTIYKILNRSSFNVKIQVFPLINWRHFHLVTDRWKIPWEFVPKQEDKGVNVQLGVPRSTLMMTTTKGRYFTTGKWIEKIYLREEANRGESCLDDCYQHGYFEVDVKADENEKFAITAVADRSRDYTQKVLAELPVTMYDVEALFERETRRHNGLLTKFYEEHKKIQPTDWLNWVISATNMFVVKGINHRQKSVIAGYHWFETWGRDTFISLPGLMLVTGRFEDARQVFLTFKNRCKQGLIPNFLPDKAERPAYNAVDATLWYVNAILQYLKYTGDFRFVREQLWETLKAIIENHTKGTTSDIHVGSDGLLYHGSQLTWMDVATDGQPITPRAGKAVEVQALWYNTLKIMELLANKFQEKNEAGEYAQISEKTRKGFLEKFWNLKKDCLFDVVSEHGKDDSLRPNQIIAVALDFTMLDNVKGEKVVDVVHRELLTPQGLRTLSRNDPRYIGVYNGDRRNRDRAYHNGAVWPWLLGPFITAFLKTKGYAEYRREYALKNFLTPLFSKQNFSSGLGVFNEIADGEPPFTPRGCIAQAWSIAEPFRAYIEEIMQVKPKHERKVLQGSG